MPNSPKQFTDYLPKLDFASSFFFNPVSPSEIDRFWNNDYSTKQGTRAVFISHSHSKIGETYYKPTSIYAYQ